MSSGWRTTTTLATAMPTRRAIRSSSRSTASSPALAASPIVSAVTSPASPPVRSNSADAWPERRSRTPAAAIAGPLATASRQPRLPHPHSGPVGSTIWWPSSPAEPSGPRRSLPSTTMPPPIPVPSANRAIVDVPRPAPSVNSPSVAARTSFSRWTGASSRSPRIRATGTSRHWVGRLGRNRVSPFSRSTQPGQPTPTAAGRSPTSRARSSRPLAIRSRTGSHPS